MCVCVSIHVLDFSGFFLTLDSTGSVEQLPRLGSQGEKEEDLACLTLVLPDLHSSV